jgi:hypothetical protein
MGAREAGSTLRADPAGRQHQQDEMPVHDKQMLETQMPDTKLKWTRVAPMKWRKVAPAATVVADDAADQSAKRARTLTLNNKTVADFKNWLDFLAHMDHDAYITLMRYMVGTGVIEYNRKDLRDRTYSSFEMLGVVAGWGSRRGGVKHSNSRDINIYGLRYPTTSNRFKNVDIPRLDHQIFPSGAQVFFEKKKFFDKKNLLATAEANGIKVFKSWSKPRIWKALLSA